MSMVFATLEMAPGEYSSRIMILLDLCKCSSRQHMYLDNDFCQDTCGIFFYFQPNLILINKICAYLTDIYLFIYVDDSIVNYFPTCIFVDIFKCYT